MKTKLRRCIPFFLIGGLLAGECLAVSSQYGKKDAADAAELERLRIEAHEASEKLAEAERAAQAAQAATDAQAATEAPRILPRKVWDRLELLDGRVLDKARANAEDAATVTFLHSGGVVKVDKRLLPAELAELFPYDADAAARQAREAARERAETAKNQAKREERAAVERTSRTLNTQHFTGTGQKSAPPSLISIEQAAQARARAYFENEKRTGSGATLVFSFDSEVDVPVEVAGWSNRWEVKGTARYKVYDSVGWGSFSSRSKKFRAQVDAPPGGKPKVVSFEER